MESPKFSSFRELMDKWDEAVDTFLENDLCLFFKKDGTLYGTTETGRITFARMKNPENKEDKDWRKEATFVAYDLEKSEEGHKSMAVLGYKHLSKIKVVSEEQAERELKKKGKKMPVIKDEDGDEGQKYGEA